MRHGENAFELTMMVRHGMKPLDAIRASTASTAKALRIDNEVGTLVPGKIADILVVDGDPLKDVEVIEKKVAYVFRDGKRVVDNLTSAVRGELR
jgi:imidazolonepropionase-like amidohydrolase